MSKIGMEDAVVVSAEPVPESGKASGRHGDKEDARDPWDVVMDSESTATPWAELSSGGKVWRVVSILLRVILALALLYLFICSLDFLGSAFQLLAGRTAGKALTERSLLDNPICGLMIGVLVTVLLQSSSTSTSITVTMVASGLIQVRQGIWIVMGANIGTSVTNTIVSLAQSADRDTFRRAFAAATVHDMFNWLTVLVLLPLEAAFHGLEKMTAAMTQNLVYKKGQKPPDMLKALTKPFTSLIVQIDKKVITAVAKNSDLQRRTMLKYFCKEKTYHTTFTVLTANATAVKNEILKEYWPYNAKAGKAFQVDGLNLTNISYTNTSYDESTKCRYLFHGMGMPNAPLNETGVGILLLIIALTVLMCALIGMVKVLHSLMRGPLFSTVKKVINAEFPGYAACFTGYVAILVGAGMTMVVQSSSVFTSTLTPLVGLGVVTVERVYPLTLGSNIGTTFTGILAALVQSENKFRQAIQLALCHLFFNIFGICIWYPIPHMRRVPIALAKGLGNKTAKYRWFAVAYLIVIFFLFPACVFALSIAGWKVLVGVGVPIVVFLVIIIIINIIQIKKPTILPAKLQNWDFLPAPLHSLAFYDQGFYLIKVKTRERCSCCACCKGQKVELEQVNVDVKPVEVICNTSKPLESPPHYDNPAFVSEKL